MNNEEMMILIDKKGVVIDSENAKDYVYKTLIEQLGERYKDFSELYDSLAIDKMIYSKFDAHEYMWKVSKKNDDILLTRYFADTMSKSDIYLLMDKILVETTQDHKKIIMRKYSHDLSNLLTVILINLGYLHDELQEGNITTSNNETVNQVVSSSLTTSTRIKNLIEQNRDENEWSSESVEGKCLLMKTLFNSFEIVRYQIDHNLLFITDFPEDREIMMNEISFTRSMQIILQNAIEAKKDSELSIIELVITEDDKNDIITLYDNGRGFKSLKTNKLSREYYTNNENRLGLGLTNLEKLISLIHGEIKFESQNRTKVCFSIPK